MADIAAAAFLRLLFPRLMSPKSASISNSLQLLRAARLFPSPPTVCVWNPPALLRRLPFPPVAVVNVPFGSCVEVSGSGNGDGSSSMDSEWGLVSGPVVTGPGLVVGVVDAGNDPRGECGGELPSLFRSFRVICGLDCESIEASAHRLGDGFEKGKVGLTAYVSFTILLLSRSPSSFLNALH